MSYWHYSHNHKRTGPVSEAELLEKISAGEIKAGTLVWTKGMKSWQPVEIHFSQALADTHTPPEAEDHNKDDAPPSSPPSPPSPPPVSHPHAPVVSIWPKLKALRISAVLMLICFAGFFGLNTHLGSDNFALNGVIWLGALLIACLSGGFFLYRLWNAGTLMYQDSDGLQGGGLKLTTLLLGLVLGAFAVSFLAQAPLFFRINKVRQAYDHYNMDVDVVGNSILIEGTIGPSFAAKLEDYLDLYAGITVIQINSVGGLVDQALKAAAIIEEHPQLTVVARQTCNSACLVILMAAEHRMADWDMGFGFHAVSSITTLPQAYDEVSILGDDADAYLIKRGVPLNILENSFSSGHNDLTMVPAIVLKEAGAITQLLDGTLPVSVPTAKWRATEDSLKPFEEKMDYSFSPVLETIRQTSPDIVSRHADTLYTSFKSGDERHIQATVRAMINDLLPRAIHAAEADALYAYTDSNIRQVAHLKNLEQWDACYNYVNGQLHDELDILSRSELQKEFDLLSALIRSAANKGWTPQPIPSWVQAKSEKLIEDTLMGMIAQGYDIRTLDSDAQASCIFTHDLVSAILDQGEQQAAPMLRWINKLGSQ